MENVNNKTQKTVSSIWYTVFGIGKDTKYKIQNTRYSLAALLFFAFLYIAYFILNTGAVRAASLDITPVVIDKQAYARDILENSIMLSNNTNRQLNIYTFVENITALDGVQKVLDPSKADFTSSLGNWIEISRGVIELKPAQEKEIKFLIRVNLRAEPGVYHAKIAFASGAKRDEAIARGELASVLVNIKVSEDIKEGVQLQKFNSDKSIFFTSPVSFSYELKNTGNRSINPLGEIRIYNKRGVEEASIDINSKNLSLNVDTNTELASMWNFAGGFGKYKAVLDVSYGTRQRGTIQDTASFWIISWKVLIVILSILVMLIFWTARLLHGRHRRRVAHYQAISSKL